MPKTGLLIALTMLACVFSVAARQNEKQPSLSIALTGAAEVPGPGDADGSGAAKLTFHADKGEVCYELTVANIEPAAAAHIHEAPAGKAGPVKVGLEAPKSGSSKGCAKADAELIKTMMKNPANYYVNVHNAEFKAGAVRGQLAQ